jgi:RNA polymerase sigma factor (sigma-70 family)
MATKLKEDTPYNDRQAWLTTLYKITFPLVAKHISRMGGSLDEAQDIFQDALIIYYEKTVHAELSLEYSDKAYLFGIARHLWNKRYKESGRQVSIDELDADFDEQAGLFNPDDQEISTSRLFQLLQTSGQKCMQLLSAFYYEKLKMESIAERFGFSGPRSATVQKFKCLEKVKETVKEKSMSYEDILE